MVDKLVKQFLSKLRCENTERPTLRRICGILGGHYPNSPSMSPQLKVIPEEHLRLAEKIWDYMLLGNTPEKCDVILALGNNDIRVAEHAAKLWLEGYGDWLMFSGEMGNLTKGKWTRTEADVFREVALNLGVPNNRIILEENATNTGENIRFSYDVLHKLGHQVSSIILVQTPFMERRTYATFMKQWPGQPTRMRVLVASPPIPLHEYPNETVGTMTEIIGLTVGCLQRIILYPKYGFQTPQLVPDDILSAYEQLVQTGLYNNFILKDDDNV
ncbi:uncharacterized protein SCO4629-like [Centruroides vittatus]|uniref:uncharacterized protein SCO4629-like n=1 Tax=Centruroides vittatus TaxID=120091 RepID=UPI00350FEF38